MEFAIVTPVFVFFLFAILGVGVDGFYQLLLDDAVRNAARQVQIDSPASASAATFVAAVCTEFSTLASDCTTNLSYNVVASSPASGFTAITPATLNASGKLPNSFFAGTAYADNVNILVQVAYPLPFTLPYVSKLVTYTNTNSVLANSSVRAEPF